MGQEIDDVKREVAIGTRLLAEFGLATGILASLGHVSMRVPNDPELFVVKGRGYPLDALAVMRPEQMVVVDMDGNLVDGPRDAWQCNEVKMHSCILRERPEVSSVTHVHPRFSIVMGLLGIKMQAMCNEGQALTRAGIPVFPHSRLILSEEDGMAVVEAMGDSSAVMLRGHGAAVSGTSVENSVLTMLQLEEQARQNYYAYSMVGRDYQGVPEADQDEFAAGMRGLAEQPHLKGPISRSRRPRGGAGQPGGVWAYYSGLVSADM